MRTLVSLIAGAALLTSCGSTEGGPPGAQGVGPGSRGDVTLNAEVVTGTPVTRTLPSGIPPSVPNPQEPAPRPNVDVPAPLLEQVRADAAQRAGVTPSEVRVLGSTAQTWNDGSLGCPRPGESYIQVLMDGFQILVQAGDRTLDYHTSQSSFRLCE